MRGIIFLVLLLVLVGCGEKRGNKSSDKIGSKERVLYRIDLKADYPKKKVELRSFADVSYIPLRTSGDAVFEGRIIYYGKDCIVGFSPRNGDVVFFSASGVETGRFNRVGKGPEEYGRGCITAYDPSVKEVYVYSYLSKKIRVYDVEGKFKRTLSGVDEYVFAGLNTVGNDLVVYVGSERVDSLSFFKLSKDDGHYCGKIDTHFKKKCNPDYVERLSGNRIQMTTWYDRSSLVTNDDGVLLNDFSSDTIFCCTADGKLLAHTVIEPSRVDLEEPWMLFAKGESDDYLFYTSVNRQLVDGGFDMRNILYSKKTDSIFTARMYDKQNPNHYQILEHPRGNGVFIELLDAYDLCDRFKKGELSGELSAIAETLKEDDNPILMVIRADS